jgi:hypothetical protein
MLALRMHDRVHDESDGGRDGFRVPRELLPIR